MRFGPRFIESCAVLSVMPLLISSTLLACSEDGRGGSGSVVRDSAGIVIVENDHQRPVWNDDGAWRLSEEPVVRIGTASGDPTEQLFRVIHSRRLREGRIAVVNTGSAEVRFYDERGSYVGAIGGRGGGPGEFRSPWAVHETPGDSLLVIDLYREISIFDPTGRFVRRFYPARPDGQIMGEGFEPVGQFGDGTLLFRSHYRQDPTWQGLRRSRIQMIRTNLDGSFGGSLGDFDDQTSLFGAFYGFGAWAKEAPAARSMWYGPGDRLELHEIGLDGSLLRLVRLDRPLRAVTEADIARYKEAGLSQVRGTPREQVMNRMMADAQFASVFPAHYDILADHTGNVWVQDYQPFSERVARVWTVFDVDGRYLGDVTIPAGFTVYEIGADHVLGRWTDELDVEYVLMYALNKPGAR